MVSREPFTLRWGILATGGIAKTFTKDLLIDPTTRDVHDIRHLIAAAASSTSIIRAQSFLAEIGAPPSAKAYGSYKELVQDDNVDIIYIATPHSHHYANARLVLEAGKHVLIEKPITINAAQCRVLIDIARAKKLFMMEAVWTRFFPLSREVVDFVREGKLGDVKRVTADFSFWNDVEKEFGTSHRMVNKELGGGALLDLGIYSLTWVFMVLYQQSTLSSSSEHDTGKAEGNTDGAGEDGQNSSKNKDPTVASAMTLYELTGADEQTTVLLHFPSGAHAIASTSIRVATTPNASHPQHAIRIQGTLGDLSIDYAPRPRTYTVTPASSASRGTPATFTHQVVDKWKEIPGNGHGMFWEADDCARCVRDGKLESGVMGLEESAAVMRVMDQVRGQGGVGYGELESTEWSGE
ncbi:NAD(P)-binding protein [Plenodomus tracheiphilus IPT5]|uniref:D-xylose 1-dehydrogenase (NADP(+), D-xylono-1,5-lactone-forming) n=1 Tax=Plenodomus tracheiphilus IPT5 TaxID=1408161 RepID=A0A6A7AQM6_9PLEO|nr:NAD(P)-binding protein [Plenodomus tracheiphilus IPT5]